MSFLIKDFKLIFKKMPQEQQVLDIHILTITLADKKERGKISNNNNNNNF